MPRKSKWTPEALQQLEDDLIERLAAGKEAESSHPLMNSSEFQQRLAARKEQLRSQSAALTNHCLSANGMASLAIHGILKDAATGVNQETLQTEIPSSWQS